MVRFKNRYITVEILPDGVFKDVKLGLKSHAFYDAVVGKIQQLHGDFGIAAVKTGFIAKYCNETTRIAILRSRHGPHKLVTSVIPFVTKIDSKAVGLRILHVGATMKQSFKFIQKHQRNYLDSKWLTLKTDEERQQFEAALMDFSKTDVNLDIEKMY